MAIITFQIPEGDSSKVKVITVNMSDDAMLSIVNAFCELEGYNSAIDISPNLFTIQKTIDFWSQKSEYNAIRKDRLNSDKSTKKKVDDLKSSIVLN